MSQPTFRLHDPVANVISLLIAGWQWLRTAFITLQLRNVAKVRNRAVGDLLFAGVYRLQAQLEYAGRIQCIDVRQEHLLAQLAAIKAEPAPPILPQTVRTVVQTLMTVKQEVAALKRIAAFEESFSIYSLEQPTYFYSIIRDGDALIMEVDFFSQRMCGQGALVPPYPPVHGDEQRVVLMSQHEVLQVIFTPCTRSSYKAAHRAARTLLAGRTFWCGNTPVQRDVFLRGRRDSADQGRIPAPMQMHVDHKEGVSHE